jgi:hypothetical protein
MRTATLKKPKLEGIPLRHPSVSISEVTVQASANVITYADKVLFKTSTSNIRNKEINITTAENTQYAPRTAFAPRHQSDKIPLP